jgi:carbon-monoxide dehydrogenase large subunit/6-hydroxypseudooxynicotine dehydrogenase subunit gamma
VIVEHEELPAALDALQAGLHGPSLWDSGETEITSLHFTFGEVDAAFEAADYVADVDVAIGRHTAVPMEARGLVAEWDPQVRVMTLWGLTKVPHFNRRVLAGMLRLPVDAVRFLSTDAGGGFGVRGEFYPEDFLIPWLAIRTRRPVKWIEDRAEHLVATNHSRQQRHRIRGAFTADGSITGLRAEIWHDNGAYMRTHGITVPELTGAMLPGPYRIPAYEATVHVVTTNKTPCGTYRAPGRYEGTFARERMLDVAAQELGLTPLDMRRRNVLRAEDMPLVRPIRTLGTDMAIDAGDVGELLEATVEAAGFEDWVTEARDLRSVNRSVGCGIAVFLEKSGLGPYETAEVRIDESGMVTVRMGGANLGQGIETVMAQIAARELGVHPADVVTVLGDSDCVPEGVGSWASRSTVVGGAAVAQAAAEVARRVKSVGARLLDTSTSHVALVDGAVRSTVEPTASVTLSEVACSVRTPDVRDRPGEELQAEAVFRVDRMTYPYGVHLAQVEVDHETGGTVVRRYFVGYEIGRAINARLVRGQILGGVAQGLGGALLEEFRYDDAGQPLSTSFMDYLCPTASEVPMRWDVLISERWPGDNPLGVRGAGEGGATGAGAAIANAVADAFGEARAVAALPITPEHIALNLAERIRTDREA